MSTSTSNPEYIASDLFHPVEHAFICDWLGVQRPVRAKEIDLYEERADGHDDEGNFIRPRAGLGGWEYEGEDKCGNAVARLLLSNIQSRLPQWGTVKTDGEVLLARDHSAVRQNAISLMPQHLFTINWADSGPGCSWPEAYYATYLPLYNIYVVTLSQDSPDAYGYEDLAIGHFPLEELILDGAHRRCQPWRAKRRLVIPGSREAALLTRRARSAPEGKQSRHPNTASSQWE
ncbi:MAG: hypothetical protein RPU32_00770, partial [Candidatus Sedimenticola sp. (ex Thyasira tokunagai)]